MKPLTIHKALSKYGDVNVVLAGDDCGRSFMGVVVNDTWNSVFLFVEIDLVIILRNMRHGSGADRPLDDGTRQQLRRLQLAWKEPHV